MGSILLGYIYLYILLLHYIAICLYIYIDILLFFYCLIACLSMGVLLSLYLCLRRLSPFPAFSSRNNVGGPSEKTGKLH